MRFCFRGFLFPSPSPVFVPSLITAGVNDLFILEESQTGVYRLEGGHATSGLFHQKYHFPSVACSALWTIAVLAARLDIGSDKRLDRNIGTKGQRMSEVVGVRRDPVNEIRQRQHERNIGNVRITQLLGDPAAVGPFGVGLSARFPSARRIWPDAIAGPHERHITVGIVRTAGDICSSDTIGPVGVGPSAGRHAAGYHSRRYHDVCAEQC